MKGGLWIGLGATFAGAGVVLFGLYRLGTSYLDFGAASDELPAAVAAYRAEGLPFTAAELVPTHPAPSRDATSGLRAAVQALPPKRTNDRLVQALKAPGPSADALLQEHYAKPLAILALVADRPEIDFHRDWALGTFVLFPEEASHKVLVRALTLRAVRSAQRGDDAAALRDLTLAIRLGVWSGQEPTLIPTLVRVACEAITLDGASRCLAAAAAASRPERIARYDRWLRALPPPPTLVGALRGEAFVGVTTARNLASLRDWNIVADSSG